MPSKYSTPTLRKKMKKTMKKVNRIARSIEKKHFDSQNLIQAVNDGNAVKLSNINQGDTSAGRTGIVVSPTYFQLKGQLQWQTAATQKTLARVIVVQDRDAQGALPTRGELLEGSYLDAQYNNVNRKRFNILHDKIYCNYNPDSTIFKQTPVEIKCKVRRPINYLGTGNANGDQGKSSMFLFVISDSSTFAGLGPHLDYSTRLYFTDL